MHQSPDISVVIPAFNEEGNCEKTKMSKLAKNKV